MFDLITSVIIVALFFLVCRHGVCCEWLHYDKSGLVARAVSVLRVAYRPKINQIDLCWSVSVPLMTLMLVA